MLFGAAALLMGRGAWAQEAAPAGGWSQFQGDAAHTGAAEAGPAPPYRRAWSFPVSLDGRQGLSAPVIAGDLAIAVGREAVHAVRLESGAEAWALPRAAGPSVPAALGVVGGTTALIFSEGSKEASRVRAVDLDTREAVWAPVALDATSRTGITVEGGRAFVGDTEGKVYAIDLADGRVAWTQETDGFLDSPLAVRDGRVFVLVEGPQQQRSLLFALDVDTGDELFQYLPTTVPPLASGPVAGGEGIYVAFSDRVLRAVDPVSGTERWGSRSNNLFSPVGLPALVDGAVFVVDLAGQVYRLDGTTGQRQWDHALNSAVLRSSPVVVGDRVLVALNDGRLVALDLATGELVWAGEPGRALLGSMAVAPELVLAVKGGKAGGLVAFEHDPGGTLVRVASPTRPDPVRILGAFGLALALIVAVVHLPARLLARRMGPPELPGDDEEGATAVAEEQP